MKIIKLFTVLFVFSLTQISKAQVLNCGCADEATIVAAIIERVTAQIPQGLTLVSVNIISHTSISACQIVVEPPDTVPPDTIVSSKTSYVDVPDYILQRYV